MRRMTLWILVLIMVVGLLILGRTGRTLDLDYGSLCTDVITEDEMIVPPMLSGIFATLDRSVDVDADGDQVNDSKLICFDGELMFGFEPYNTSLSIAANPSEITLIVYNMNLKLAPDGQVIVGDNVILDTVELSGSAAIPLKITGSGVKVLNSPGIQASSTGILIQNTSGVGIHNSTITGPGMDELDSIGISVVNSTGVEITDNPDTIENFGKGIEFDVTSDVKISNVTFTRVSQLIVGDGITVDVDENVGKKIGESGNVIRVAGFLPDISCGAEMSGNGTVEMYRQEDAELGVVSESNCEIRKVAAGEICLYFGSGATPASYDAKKACIESGDCRCSEANSCIFDCSADISSEHVVAFIYSNSQGITAPFSSFKRLGLMPSIIATYAPSVPVSAPEEELINTGNQENDTTGGNRASVEVEDGGGMDSPLGGSLGLAKGCSLTRNTTMSIPPFIILAMMLLIPVAVRVHSRSHSRNRRK